MMTMCNEVAHLANVQLGGLSQKTRMSHRAAFYFPSQPSEFLTTMTLHTPLHDSLSLSVYTYISSSLILFPPELIAPITHVLSTLSNLDHHHPHSNPKMESPTQPSSLPPSRPPNAPLTPTISLTARLIGISNSQRPLTISLSENLPTLRRRLRDLFGLRQLPTLQVSWGREQGTEKRELLTGVNVGEVFDRMEMLGRTRMRRRLGVGILVCPDSIERHWGRRWRGRGREMLGKAVGG